MAALFIDESKDPRYVLAATLVNESEIARLRKTVRALVRPGQRSIHFYKEKNSHRRKLLSTYERLGFKTLIFESTHRNDLEARRECFDALIGVVAEFNILRLVIEKDVSILKFDEAMIEKLIRVNGLQDELGFEHFLRHEEPLLWVPDAVAWCANRGGEWRERASGLVIKNLG